MLQLNKTIKDSQTPDAAFRKTAPEGTADAPLRKLSLKTIKKELIRLFPIGTILSILAGTAILSFGLVNVHRRTGITEGGVLGMLLLLNHWAGLPASLLSPLLDAFCYLIGFKYLGRDFLARSAAATFSLACFLKLWESLPPLFPDLSSYPLAASLTGAAFVGIGVGLVVCRGASSGGDDALALVISKLTGCRLSKAYLATDLTVLALSMTYIPFSRIAYSLITVTISSLLIDAVTGFVKRRQEGSGEAEPVN